MGQVMFDLVKLGLIGSNWIKTSKLVKGSQFWTVLVNADIIGEQGYKWDNLCPIWSI